MGRRKEMAVQVDRGRAMERLLHAKVARPVPHRDGAAIEHHRARRPDLREVAAERAALIIKRPVRSGNQQADRADRDDQTGQCNAPLLIILPLSILEWVAPAQPLLWIC